MPTGNSDRFFGASIHYFKVIGFEFDAKRLWMRLLFFIGLANMIFILLAQIAYIVLTDLDLDEDASYISFINYFLVAFGKSIALMYNRKPICDTIAEFRRIYPSVEVEKKYNLQRYLNIYLLIEKVLVWFFQSITTFYLMLPIYNSIKGLIVGGHFSFRTPLMLWYSEGLDEKYLLCGLTYLMEIHSTYVVAIIILCLDLSLFSSLLQLCMHFVIINGNIASIEPDHSREAEKKLKKQIVYHQTVLGLADRVNSMFTPTVLFSLLSSSFIICFIGFDLLNALTPIMMIKLVFLLMYELKQVVITCYLGDLLIDTSSKTAEAIYEHKWYNGTIQYKRMVLIALIRSQRPAALNIAGISDVSLQTLRAVLSISYKAFTVLKST